jgi:hypothetical protein
LTSLAALLWLGKVRGVHAKGERLTKTNQTKRMKQLNNHYYRAAAALSLLLATSTARSQTGWALDVLSEATSIHASPYTGNTQDTTDCGAAGQYSWSIESYWRGDFAFSPTNVLVNIDCDASSRTTLYRATVANLTAYCYAQGYATAFWKWYGAPGASTPITAHLTNNIGGDLYASGSASGPCSTTSYGQGLVYAAVEDGVVNLECTGYALAQGSVASCGEGTGSLTGLGQTFSNEIIDTGPCGYSVSAGYTIVLDCWYTTPAGRSYITPLVKGTTAARSVSNGSGCTETEVDMGGSSGYASAWGKSEVDLSW